MRLALMEYSDRPLYDQIGHVIRKRILDKVYRPGVPLPGEAGLALELDVSQGTVRKALDVLVNEKILFRRQGLGTFVSEHTEQRLQCLYFNINHDNGERIRPDSRQLALRTCAADRAEQAKLDLRPGEKVIRSRRVRFSDGLPIIAEHLSIPSAIFPKLAALPELPEILYPYYQSEYNVVITKVREQLKAIAASPADAKLLDVEVGAPLLFIDRIALMANQSIVEWRRITCRSDDFHFACERS